MGQKPTSWDKRGSPDPRTPQWRAEGGGGQGGGHGPRAQALEGAPAQLVGANFKKKIRPRIRPKTSDFIAVPDAPSSKSSIYICIAQVTHSRTRLRTARVDHG